MLVPPNFWTTHPLGLSFLTVGFMVDAAGCSMRRIFAVVIDYVTLPRERLSLCEIGSGGTNNESKEGTT